MAIADAGAGTRTQRAHFLYRSGDFAAEAESAMNVDVSIESIDFNSLRESIVALISMRRGATGPDLSDPQVLREVLENAAAEMFSRTFAAEIDKLICGYRVMLRESMIKGDDPELQAALNRARLQERILAGTAMADQAEACELLGLSSANASATMKRREDRQELMRFTIEGKVAYPLFQFDVEARRLYPVIGQLIAMKPSHWSDFRLLHWLTRSHLDFDGTPAEALATEADAVSAAFALEIEPAVTG